MIEPNFELAHEVLAAEQCDRRELAFACQAEGATTSVPSVDDAERRRRLAAYGFGTATPPFWHEVIRRQVQRIQDEQDAFASIIESAQETRKPIQPVEGYDPRVTIASKLLMDALYVVLAMRQVQRIAQKLNGILRDPRVGAAINRFEGEVPQAGAFRDFIEHLDDYAIGAGRLPLMDSTEQFDVRFDSESDLRGELILRFGGHSLPLKDSATAAMRLARETNDAWWKAMRP